MAELSAIKQSLEQLCEEVFNDQNTIENKVQLCVLGCSSSEVSGFKIGAHSNPVIGETIVAYLMRRCREEGIALAVQACEHLNRALVIEADIAIQRGYSVVNVVPHLKAGGSAATAAYKLFKNPVLVEHVQAEMSIDIGDTETAQHVRWVQIPKRYSVKFIGDAHVRVIKSRPKYIGGPRAEY